MSKIKPVLSNSESMELIDRAIYGEDNGPFDLKFLEDAFERGAVIDNDHSPENKSTFYCAVNHINNILHDHPHSELDEQNLESFFSKLFENGMTTPQNAIDMATSHKAPQGLVDLIQSKTSPSARLSAEKGALKLEDITLESSKGGGRF